MLLQDTGLQVGYDAVSWLLLNRTEMHGLVRLMLTENFQHITQLTTFRQTFALRVTQQSMMCCELCRCWMMCRMQVNVHDRMHDGRHRNLLQPVYAAPEK